MLLSATPHDGSTRSFASLMSLLDPTAISDPDHYTPEDFRSKGLVVRRFKKDICDQVSAGFQERETTCLREKALFTSPKAALESTQRRICQFAVNEGRRYHVRLWATTRSGANMNGRRSR